MKKLLMTAVAVGLASSASAALTQNWFIAAEDSTVNASALIANDTANQNNERGFAYNPTTGNLLVASKRGGAGKITKVAAATGVVGTTLNNGGSGFITGGGGGVLTEIAVTTDGVIYACSLATSAANFKIYRWADENATPTVAFGPSASPQITARTGDSFALTGTGVNTIIYASGSGNAVVEVFTTADGLSFTPGTDIAVPAAGDARSGIAVRTDNGNLLIKVAAGSLKEITTAGAVVGTGSGTTVGTTGPIGFYTNGSKSLVATQSGTLTPAFGRAWDITGGVSAAANNTPESDTPGMGSTANGNGSGEAAFAVIGGQLRMFVLSTNNGIGSYGNNTEFGVSSAVNDWTAY